MFLITVTRKTSKRFALAGLALISGMVHAADQPTLAVSTSLPIKDRNEAPRAFDGKRDTWFLSERALRDGDDFTATLPEADDVTSIEVQTGVADGTNALDFGVLEVSDDGVNFSHAAVFSAGKATAEPKRKLKAFRLRATGSTGKPLAIAEVTVKAAHPLPSVRFVTRFEVHCETASKAKGFADKSKGLCDEWYPKLYTLYDTANGPAPRSVVRIYFQNMDGVAYTTRGDEVTEIHVSNQWVTEKSPNDYGMVIHELFHVVQTYPGGGGEGWLTEGLADYVRFRLFEPKVLKPNPDKSSYRDAYQTTAAFLMWLEDNKKKGLSLTLNEASRTSKRPIIPLFKQETGEDIDVLWKAFTDSLR